MSATFSAQVEPLAFHASAVLIGERAIVLRGASGRGKSALSLVLIAAAAAKGRFARLVADDRLYMRRAGGRLIAAPHPRTAGRIERRFAGIADIAHVEEAVVALVVDLVAPDTNVARLPTDEGCWTTIAGVRIRRLTLPASYAFAVETILHAVHKSWE